MDNLANKRLIVLFDEFGTPTFNFKSNEEIFLGVSVLYDLEKENEIFNDCDKELGLSKSKPLKNNKISVNKAKTISHILGKQSFIISAKYLNLDNSELKNIVDDYKNIGDLSRKIYRGVGERKVAHILYSAVLNECLFNIVADYLESFNSVNNCCFEIYIDDWSIPVADKNLFIEDLKLSLKSKMESLFQDCEISMNNLVLLDDNNSKRKRLIDIITSVICRAFLDLDNSKYDTAPLNILKKRLETNIKIHDITDEMSEFYDEMIKKSIEETKVKDNNIILI